MKKIKIQWVVGVLILIVFNVLLFDIAVKRSIDYIEIPVAAKMLSSRSKIDEFSFRMQRVPSALVEGNRSEERRGGKDCRSRLWPYD